MTEAVTLTASFDEDVIYLKEPSDQVWKVVSGKTDTRAATTVISEPLHGHLCFHKWERLTPLAVSFADQNFTIPVKKEGLIHLKVNNRDFGLVKALLVDSTTWRNVLVGRDLLNFHGLLPRI